MKVMILGNGGREHALAWKCAQDNHVTEVLVAPGNAGTAREAKCRNIALKLDDNAAIITCAQHEQVDLIIVGPEAPLVNGVVDACQAAGLAIWGPTQAAAQLEGSKAFAKAFMQRHGIPTAFYEVFTDVQAATAFIQQHGAPIVVKADGLAAGKGVVVATTVDEAIAAVEDMLSGNRFGEAGSRVVIEEFLAGEEATFIAMLDGTHILPMASSQDHKRIFEQDQGPNTGGMGAYSPAPVVTAEIHERVMAEIMYPTMQGMAQDGTPYRGFLYAGLMIDAAGQPKVIEYNCRFGDPETQPVMMRLQTSLVELVQQGLVGSLPAQAQWDPRPALGIVMAAANYPETPATGDLIEGLDTTLPPDVKVFLAGVNAQDNALVTSGGRVLCVTALAETIAQAQQLALQGCAQIQFTGAQYRRDIGYRAIARDDA